MSSPSVNKQKTVTTAAALQLQRELKDIMTDPVNDYCKVILESDNIFDWTVYIVGPPATEYERGIFKTQINFPPDYPMSPPTMRFLSEFWHPNVYTDGKVCISILHTPDPMNPDEHGQNWTPAQSSYTIIVSVISMLSDPNFSSPANVDASVELRKNPEEYKNRIRRLVEKSQKELPPDFEMPKAKGPPKLSDSAMIMSDDDDALIEDDYGAEEDDNLEDEFVDEDE